jgi:CHAT domain-containing protein
MSRSDHLTSGQRKDPAQRDRLRIHWCATGAFAFTPLHAAGIYQGPEQESCFDYVVSSYTPTLSALLRAQQSAQSYERSQASLLLVAARSSQDTSLPQLLEVDSEVQGISDMISRTPDFSGVVERTACRDKMIVSLGSANIVHLACHGIQDRKEPHNSHFCLSDGSLTVAELMQIDLNDAFFAFLGACETAQGDRQNADEVVHLAASMMFAGFKSVVATMW